MRRRTLFVLPSLFLVTLVAASPAHAECPTFPIPPATEAVRSAREIVVGTVIENVGGRLYDFRLRIDRVLRGPGKVGEVRRLNSLLYGWDPPPLYPCSALPGWEGNVIALAIGATAPDGTTRYNAASWISGDLEVSERDLPRTTLDEMLRLAELPATDAAPTPTPGPSGAPLALVVLTGAVAAVVIVLRSTRVRSG
jgi:hypothetical protein